MPQAAGRMPLNVHACRTAAANGALWGNGARGLLRTNFRSKVASATNPKAEAGTAPADQPSTSGRVTSAPSMGRADMVAPAAEKPGDHAAKKSAAVSLMPGAAAIPQRQKPNVMTIHHEDDGGMGCGTDDGDLASGAFNEAESHRSFLEALNEWRSGNKAPPEPSVAAASAVHRPMEVQTETAAASRPPRPVSAGGSKKSYFSKYAINTASRDAGAGASRDASAAASAGSSRPGTPSGGGGANQQVADQAHPCTAPDTSVEGRLAVLERLEELERQREQATAKEEDSGGEDSIEVTTHKALGLVKGMRLPDAIVVPSSHHEEED